MTDEPDTVDSEAAIAKLRVLERRPPDSTVWSNGDIVRRTVMRRRRRRVIFGGTSTAVIVALALTLSLTTGSRSSPVHVVTVPGVHVGARIDGAVQLVSDAHHLSPVGGSVTAAVHAQQLLAIELLRNLGTTRRNTSVSPSSLQLALGMLENGARGTTKKQIARALQTPGLSAQQQNAQLALLTGKLSAAARGHVRLDSANSLWQQQGFRLKPRFLQAIAPYGAGVWQTNFETSQGLDAINHWTDANTHGTIPKLFASLDPTTVLVLANALYLHADWQTQFEKAETTTGRFTTGAGSHVTAHYMSSMSATGVSTTAFDAAQLPYRGGRIAALVVMPRRQPLPRYVADLTPASLSKVIGALHSASSRFGLPRFTSTTTSNLVPTLTKLGMREAFTPSADLSGLSSTSTMVDQVIQRVYLRVNEKGTTAAAATGGSVIPQSLVAGPSISFDHPFLFLVHDTKTGAILFASEINDPTAG